MGGARRHFGGPWTWALLLLLLSCRSERREPYVRVGDTAPEAFRAAGPTLVAFWGSWCPPCVEEAAALRALAEAPPAGLQVVVVPVDEGPAAARAALGEAVALREDEDRTLVRALRVGELPVAFLVAGGRVVARFDGPRAWDGAAARDTLARLIEEARPVDRQR